MKPTKFKEANKILVKPTSMTDKECRALPAFSNGNECVSCWKMSFLERLKALLFGRIWLGVLSGETQPPVWVSVDKTVFEKEDDK